MIQCGQSIKSGWNSENESPEQTLAKAEDFLYSSREQLLPEIFFWDWVGKQLHWSSESLSGKYVSPLRACRGYIWTHSTLFSLKTYILRNDVHKLRNSEIWVIKHLYLEMSSLTVPYLLLVWSKCTDLRIVHWQMLNKAISSLGSVTLWKYFFTPICPYAAQSKHMFSVTLGIELPVLDETL